MQTISMIVKYDGSNYHGWQRQSRLKSVQGVLETALSRTFGQAIAIDGSGRTDAGVHALGQCVSFQAELTLPKENIKFVVNRYLPSDIYVEKVTLETDAFHARYDAIGKTYIYKVNTNKERDPFLANFSYHYPYELDLSAVRDAMPHFIGTHDFKTYMAMGSRAKTTLRSIYSFKLDAQESMLVFTITGDGFLYNMVRIIIGTLLQVGTGKVAPDDIPSIILSGDRNRARLTVPANGLYLEAVYYDEESLAAYF